MVTVSSRTAAACLLVAVCGLLAGCGSAADETGTPTPEVTTPTAEEGSPATPTKGIATDEPTSTPTPSPPPGTNGTAIDDREALFTAHYDVIGRHDYVLRYRYAGPTDLREPTARDTIPVRTVGVVRSNLTEKRQLLSKEQTFPSRDGRSTNRTIYTSDTRSYTQFGGADADGTPFDVYYTLGHWENSDFPDRHVTQISYLRHAHLRAYHAFFTANLTRTNVTRTDDSTYYTYRPAATDEQAATGYVLVRADGFIKTLKIRATIEGTDVELDRTYSLGPVPVEPPRWKEQAVRAEQRRSGSGGDVDCDDFATQAGAQAYHESTGGAGLDGDGDGIACEHLP